MADPHPPRVKVRDSLGCISLALAAGAFLGVLYLDVNAWFSVLAGGAVLLTTWWAFERYEKGAARKKRREAGPNAINKRSVGIFDAIRTRDKGGTPDAQGPLPPSASRTDSSPGRWQVGDRIQGQYQIIKICGGPGKSGMGIVYVCYDHVFKSPVALKTFQDRFLSDQAAIDSFKREAETWIRLEKHHNIVTAKWVQMIEARPYIGLEYVAGDKRYGSDLSGWIWQGGLRQNGNPDIPLILNFALQFCHGMTHAKKKFEEMGKPFVHRDIKPSNIMITQDRVVKVTDFGLVKSFVGAVGDIPSMMIGNGGHQRLGLSKSGGICGTPPYMSPEQCRGENDIDERSDIYSFGCVLHEMLTGRYVFGARTPEGFLKAHLNSLPQSPNVHPRFDKAVLRCLEKNPTDRYTVTSRERW
jgi:serine/threonine protein kinase